MRSNRQATWERLLLPQEGYFPPDVARWLLSLTFPPDDHKRVKILSAKAQKGSLTPAERSELDDFLHVADHLAILQSRARQSLKHAGLSAKG